MDKFRDVTPGDRVRVTSDRPFTCYLEGPDSEMLFVGPRVADLRTTSFTVPKGYAVLTVQCEADSLTSIDIAPNRAAQMDEHSMLVALESEQPQDVKDLIANEVARLLSLRGQTHVEPETIEEAYDFDMDDDDFAVDPWAVEVQELAEDQEIAQSAKPTPTEAASEPDSATTHVVENQPTSP